jgi:Ca2+-binding RTX toxin-like protein
LTGGTQANDFVFSNGVSLAGNLNSGAGGGTLDESHATAAVNINLAANTATGVGGLATNLTAAIGGSATNTLTGANTTNTWNITGKNAGTINGSFTFTAFANLTGGSGNDDFVFSNGQGVTGTINGGAGTNRLDYSAYTTGLYVNLHSKVATGTGRISNIEQVFGGSGNDVLVGFGSGILLEEGSGNDLIIGGSGQATIQSGSGQDIVIAGSTSYDTNQTALQAIESYWATMSIPFLTRVSQLSGVGTPTGHYKLNSSTVTHATASDTLTLGSANDWVFWRLTGTNADQLTGTPGDSTFI